MRPKIEHPPKWNAAEYAANSSLQQNWARELIARIPLRGDEHILDIGCGDGKVTAELVRAVPRGSVVGVDASPEMITFAQQAFPATAFPRLTFQRADARKLRFQGWFDLVFSNAALHWMDDHEAVLQGAAAALKPGGRLLVSCGGRGNAHDVFLALRPEMRLKRWREFFRRMPMPYFFHAPTHYERWLPRCGFKIHTLQLTPKDVTHADAAAFAAWLRTTWLPFTQRVPENQREEFIGAVASRYIAQHPPDDQGRISVRMVRLEIEAKKKF